MTTYKVFKGNTDKIKTNVLPPTNRLFNIKYIGEVNFANDGITTIYEVPAGKMFILLGCYISARTTGGTNGDCVLYVDNFGSLLKTTPQEPTAPELQGVNSNLSLSFPNGVLRFGSASRFRIESGGADAKAWGGIVGYECDAKDIQNIPII